MRWAEPRARWRNRHASQRRSAAAAAPGARRNSACLNRLVPGKGTLKRHHGTRHGKCSPATRRPSAARDHQAGRVGTPVHPHVQGLRLQPDLGRSGRRSGRAEARAASPAHHHRVGRMQRPQLSRRGTRAHHRGRPQSEPCGADQAEAAGVRSSSRPRRRSSASSATRTTKRTGTCSTISSAAGSIPRRAAIGRSACRCAGGGSTCSRAISTATDLLGRFIGVLHVVAKLHGKRLQDILKAKTPGGAARDLRADDRAAVRQPGSCGSCRACR